MILGVVVFIGKRLGNTWKQLISRKGKADGKLFGGRNKFLWTREPLDSQFIPKQEMGIMVKSTKSVTIGENTTDISSPVISKMLIFAVSGN